MGWIKAQLSDEMHDQLKQEAEERDMPIHEYAGRVLEEEMGKTQTQKGRRGAV